MCWNWPAAVLCRRESLLKKSRETFSTQTFWITCWVCGLNWWPLKLNLTQQSQKWSQRIFCSSGVVCVFGWNLFICMFWKVLCTFSLAICVCSDFCTLHSVVIFCPKPVPFRLQHHNALSKACFHGQTGYQVSMVCQWWWWWCCCCCNIHH